MGEAGVDFGGYLIDREIGRGGHAGVYQAHHETDPGTPVALKILDDVHRTPAGQGRLKREFDFAAALDHPHLVRVYRHGSFWLAMQFVGGGKVTRLRTLQDQLAALAQIAAALDYAHRRGIVHCDVKPANILISEDFARAGAVLTDFGSAHAVVEDVWHRPVVGKPEVSLPYSAPEILRGRAPSAATDEYALACTAVELLTGAPPFPARSAADLVDAHLRRLPPPLADALGSRAVDVVMERALAKFPARRYESCTDFVEQLSRALVSRSVPARHSDT